MTLLVLGCEKSTDNNSEVSKYNKKKNMKTDHKELLIQVNWWNRRMNWRTKTRTDQNHSPLDIELNINKAICFPLLTKRLLWIPDGADSDQGLSALLNLTHWVRQRKLESADWSDWTSHIQPYCFGRFSVLMRVIHDPDSSGFKHRWSHRLYKCTSVSSQWS